MAPPSYPELNPSSSQLFAAARTPTGQGNAGGAKRAPMAAYTVGPGHYYPGAARHIRGDFRTYGLIQRYQRSVPGMGRELAYPGYGRPVVEARHRYVPAWGPLAYSAQWLRTLRDRHGPRGPGGQGTLCGHL